MPLESEKNKTPGAPTASASVNTLAADPELLGDFILESREHLTSIELQLLALDQDPANSEAIHAIFRGFHTIKGMAGFLDMNEVRDLAHEVETVLDLARNAKLAITSTIIDRILESKDYLNVWMTELDAMLQTGKTPSAPDAGGLLEAIRSLGTGSPPIPANIAAPAQAVAAPTNIERLQIEVPLPIPVPATQGLSELA